MHKIIQQLLCVAALTATSLPGQDTAPVRPSGPLTIRAAVELSARNYPAIRVSLAEVAAAESSVDLAKTAYLPREFGIYHFEEPVAQYDYAGIRRVTEALDVPVSAGEHEYTRWQFRDLIEQAKQPRQAPICRTGVRLHVRIEKSPLFQTGFPFCPFVGYAAV